MLRTLTILSLFQLALSAAPSASVSNPTVGYSLNAGQLVRFSGIPGAAQASPDSSGTQYALLVNASAAPIALLLSADGSKATYVSGDYTLPVSLSNPTTNLAISPTGNYFVALYASGLQLFNRSGAVIATADLSAILSQGSPLTQVLITDQGEILLAGPNTFWYSAKNAESFTAVPVALKFAKFMPHDHLIVAYDAGQGRVIAVHPASAFAVEPLITAHDNLTAVTGLQFGADGTSVWVTQQSGPLLHYDLIARTNTSFPVSPGVLSAPLAPGVFLWNQPGTSNVILDTTQAMPAVLVVPTAATPVLQ